MPNENIASDVNLAAPTPSAPVQPATPATPAPTSGALDPQSVALAQAIRQTESNNNPTAQGKSGEYGAYQWEPATWNAMSASAGVNVPLRQSTLQQQNQVAYTQIKAWKDAGYNVGQIASMWNAGSGAPNAYLNDNVGTNAEGVSYNTPAYAEKVATLYQQFKNSPQGQTDPSQGEGLGQEIAGGAEDLAKGAANLVLGPAESLGTHLGQLAAGGTADIENAVGDSSGAQAIQQKLQQPVSTLTGGQVQPLQGGLGGAEQIGGDALQTGLLAAGPEVGAADGVLGRLASNAALGAGFGAGNAMSNAGSASDIGTGALTGGLVGGAVGGASELLQKAATYLPQRLVQSFVKGISPETAQYALDTKNMGPIDSLLSQSNDSLSSIGAGIGAAVKGAVADGATLPDGASIFQNIAAQFPDSGMTADDVAAQIKQLVPLKSKIVDKIMDGTASVEDLQSLNSDLGGSVYKQFLDNPTVKAGKEVGNTAYHEFGDLIKSYLNPDESALYDQYSKESQLNLALQKAARSGAKSKIISLNSILGLLAGSPLGPVGMGVGFLAEKAATNPTVNLKTAGLLSSLATPAAQGIGQAIKAPIIKGATGLLQAL